MTPRHGHSDDGFTLIELLVALALLGFLGALVSGGLHSAAMGWRHIERQDADREERRNIQRTLQSLLSQISPARYFGSSRTIV
jgi:prepilin-type N-terminal cleavage/methylation domain-containing protein